MAKGVVVSWLKKRAEEAARATHPDHRHDERGHTEVVAEAIECVALEFTQKLRSELQYLAEGCACVGEFPCCKNCIATDVAKQALAAAGEP
jgi:hypothetical protein